MSYLLDTNVVSELRKGPRCDPGVARWLESAPDEQLYLSVLVLGELRRGIESIRRRDAQAAASLDAWFRQISTIHGDRILPIDAEIAEVWGPLNVPDPLPAIDALLAATAKVHGFTVVTRNVEDFARTGVPCLNPFSGS